jgi:hypothetical protein
MGGDVGTVNVVEVWDGSSYQTLPLDNDTGTFRYWKLDPNPVLLPVCYVRFNNSDTTVFVQDPWDTSLLETDGDVHIRFYSAGLPEQRHAGGTVSSLESGTVIGPSGGSSAVLTREWRAYLGTNVEFVMTDGVTVVGRATGRIEDDGIITLVVDGVPVTMTIEDDEDELPLWSIDIDGTEYVTRWTGEGYLGTFDLPTGGQVRVGVPGALVPGEREHVTDMLLAGLGLIGGLMCWQIMAASYRRNDWGF